MDPLDPTLFCFIDPINFSFLFFPLSHEPPHFELWIDCWLNIYSPHNFYFLSQQTRSYYVEQEMSTMGRRKDLEVFESQFNDVISRLESKLLFQTEWDIGFVVIFFVFVGLIVLLVLLVLIRCCCCEAKPKRHKVGIENVPLES
ncbi:small integral membrane protein 22 [Stigmatopora nigra]